MRLLFILLALTTPMGCACDCAPARGTGDAVDFGAHTADVVAMIGETRIGTVSDQPWPPRDGMEIVPCSDVDATFTFSLAVTEPDACWDGVLQELDCSAAWGTSYPVAGSLFVEEEEETIQGTVEVWSEVNGLVVSIWLDAPGHDYPYEDVRADVDGQFLGEAVFNGFTWNRRLSEGTGVDVWEFCGFGVE